MCAGSRQEVWDSRVAFLEGLCGPQKTQKRVEEAFVCVCTQRATFIRLDGTLALNVVPSSP